MSLPTANHKTTVIRDRKSKTRATVTSMECIENEGESRFAAELVSLSGSVIAVRYGATRLSAMRRVLKAARNRGSAPAARVA